MVARPPQSRQSLSSGAACALAVCALTACGLLTGCGTASGPLAASDTAATNAPGTGAGIPRALLAEARPIGRGRRFHPSPSGHPVGRCRRTLGPRVAVHIEVFAANRVVIVPAGIGAGAPWRTTAGRVTAARCYGALVTLEPTGVVLVARSSRLRLANFFRAWGQPFSPRRVASFQAPGQRGVAVFVGGHRRVGPPGAVPLTTHAEIVIEIGPRVPPHASYTFPPDPPPPG